MPWLNTKVLLGVQNNERSCGQGKLGNSRGQTVSSGRFEVSSIETLRKSIESLFNGLEVLEE